MPGMNDRPYRLGIAAVVAAPIHTEVFPGYEGRGIAASLARFALDDARRRSLRVIASCPYLRRYLETHPEDRDIVVGMGA